MIAFRTELARRNDCSTELRVIFQIQLVSHCLPIARNCVLLLLVQVAMSATYWPTYCGVHESGYCLHSVQVSTLVALTVPFSIRGAIMKKCCCRRWVWFKGNVLSDDWEGQERERNYRRLYRLFLPAKIGLAAVFYWLVLLDFVWRRYEAAS